MAIVRMQKLSICATKSHRKEILEALQTLGAVQIITDQLDDPELERMRMVVTSMLRMKDDAISIHDFRMVPGTGHTNLIFDVSLPIQLHGQEGTIQTALETALNDLGEGRYRTLITFDPAGFNQ